MLLFLLKRKRFIIGFLFLTVMLVWSFLPQEGIKQIRFITDSRGNLLRVPPYPPFTIFFLGSERYGYNLGQMILQGAKYTIGTILVVTVLRMLISIMLSACLYTLKERYYRGLKTIFEPFSIVPQNLIAFFTLFSILTMPMMGFTIPLWKRVAFEIFILILIAIPNLTIHISNELRMVLKESFIEASKTLGAKHSHLFFKHMIPHLHEKWILLFGQQFLQVLQLLTHLGVLGLFVGGSIVQYGSTDPPKSLSNEWSGLIGSNFSYLFVDQWILLVPMSFFVFTAVSVFFINDSIKDYFQWKDSIRHRQHSTE